MVYFRIRNDARLQSKISYGSRHIKDTVDAGRIRMHDDDTTAEKLDSLYFVCAAR